MAISTPTPTPATSMQLAEILSDLVSLRVCDPASALALVSAKPQQGSHERTVQETEKKEEQDPDLKRAKDLVHLHYEVKEKRGELARGLEEARRAVEGAV